MNSREGTLNVIATQNPSKVFGVGKKVVTKVGNIIYTMRSEDLYNNLVTYDLIKGIDDVYGIYNTDDRYKYILKVGSKGEVVYELSLERR